MASRNPEKCCACYTAQKQSHAAPHLGTSLTHLCLSGDSRVLCLYAQCCADGTMTQLLRADIYTAAPGEQHELAVFEAAWSMKQGLP
eukprot:432766-Pelagomonas_calceolata.AAC.2